MGKQAKELGFVRDTYEKICRLTEILKFLENDNLLGNSLALKGGTAINLTIFDLPRLSVDIDLDFSENVSRDDMMASRIRINDRIHKFMSATGYSLSSKSKDHYALESLVFNYINTGGMKDNIKVEINYMLRNHVLEINQRHFRSTWEPEGVSVLSVAPIEIFASKIVALLNRTAPRDLFDIHNLVKSNMFNESEKYYCENVSYSTVLSVLNSLLSNFNLTILIKSPINALKQSCILYCEARRNSFLKHLNLKSKHGYETY